MRIYCIIALIFLSACTGAPSQSTSESPLRVPPGFVVEEFASHLGAVRMMAWRDGELYAALPRDSAIIALKDGNNDGISDERRDVARGLDKPHSIDFRGDWMYIAQEGSLARVMLRGGVVDDSTYEEIIGDVPRGGHWTRTVLVDDDAVYFSIGSSCNVCVEDDARRAAILRCSPEGGCDVFASGSRNAVGLAINPADGAVYATENGRDWLGDDWPPEEINRIEAGAHYGWPYCVGNQERDASFPGDFDCELTRAPVAIMQAHSAPLGIAFYSGSAFPAEWHGRAFVAFHGSWNRAEKTGYKVVAIDVDSGDVRDFATGWLADDGSVLGRPVGVLVSPDGALYVSDDGAGIIYRITYAG